ncbi:hypothetical protein BDN67DRAFT_95359 [Paxillus ammoniavirescens]|nr:hypothetical protein BDN67DRAFT_95359 [Paxillus ammoniavirescens]
MPMRIAGYPDDLHYGQQYVADSPSTTMASGQPSSLPNSVPARQPSEPSGGVNKASFAQEVRRCSVRGCHMALPPDAANKMCDECRGRHRIYAMTKRAKRKQEKAAILSQTSGIASSRNHGPIWMPEETIEGMEQNQQSSAVHPVPGPSQPGKDTVATPLYESPSQTQWESTDLDPRLFASQSSELAGALTYTSPTTQTHQACHNDPPVETAPVSRGGFEDQPPLSVPQSEPNTSPEPSEGSPLPPLTSSSARYCSVKGCKAIIRGEYFFRMCESCRNRYRGYGITKRAKWKQSREAANAELDTLREEEDKSRAERGLPPLDECPADFLEWEAKTIEKIDGPGPIFAEDGTVRGPVLPARMCTVSHCHRVLSGHYKYRRCEQHRLQNRYHSRLKRVREKDLKAIGPGVFDDGDLSDEEDEDHAKKPRLLEPLFTSAPIDIVRGAREDDYDNEETAHYMEQMAGIPPAARGIRRDNHVCSVKTCFNLLSPSVPWKMCDTCRAHDRQVRHERRLRDLGELPPLPPRASQKKARQPTEKSTNDTEDDGQNDESVDHTAQPFASSNATDASLDVPRPDDDISDRVPDGTLVFTEPLTPPPVDVDSNAPSNEEPSTALDPPPVAVQGIAPTTSIDGTSFSTTATVHRRVRKSANQRIGQTSFPAFPIPTPSAYTQPNPSFRPPSGGGPYMPPAPPYPPPYYMHHPYSMPPFNGPQPYAHPYVAGSSTPTATPSLLPLASAQAQLATSSHPNQHHSHPLPMPAQSGPYGPYPSHPYGPYASYPYPYLPPGQYMPHAHPYPPYPGPYAPPVYGGHYQMPPSGVHPPNTQAQPVSSPASTSQSLKRKKTNSPATQVPTPSSSVPPSPLPPMSTMPPMAQMPSTFITQPPVLGPLPGLESQATPVSDENEENDIRQHLARQDEANALPSQRERQCHMCHRSLAASVNGTICERCRTKLKKRSAKVKQRFKLEPRKAAIRVGAS